MEFQKICEDVVNETEGALGCLVVNLRTGLTLASAQRPGASLGEAEINKVLRSSEDLFRGNLVNQFVRSLPTAREAASGFMREVQITTSYTYRFMAAMPGWEDGLVILITEKTLNLGIGWMAVHHALERFAQARPGTAQHTRTHQADSLPQRAPPSGQDARLQSPRQPSMPVPSMPSTPVQAPSAPEPQPAPEPEAWDQPPVAPMREPPRAPATDPAPVSPPRYPPAAEPVPDTLAAKERQPQPADTAPKARESDDEPESTQPILSGPRAKMFRPRRSKKKNR